MSQRHQTCRRCGEYSFRAYDEMVRTGPRHWYHFACYLDAGKSLESLDPSTVGRMPYKMLKERGLLERAEQIAGLGGHN